MSTEATIYQTARSMGMPAQLSYLIVAQAKHETGNFTSNFFKKYNNAFGYSYSGSKYQTGHGTPADNGVNIAAYANVADSTREVVDWIKRRQGSGIFPADLNQIQTPTEYADALRRGGYYTDTLANYTNGIKAFFLENPAWAASGSLMVFAIAIGLYWLLKR